MTSFKLDNGNNIVFNSNIVLVSENEAVAQDAKNRLLMFQTEYPFDLEQGIPYYELAKQNNKAVIENAIIERLLEDTRIKSVNTVRVNFVNKKMEIQSNCTLSNGDTIDV